jgi:diguanylate cyclase (GGDEF)-like protein
VAGKYDSKNMTRKNTIKLLLINESDNESERLVSLFRNAGRVARATRVSSIEDLHSKLENDSPDLIIADDKHPEVSVEQCLEQVSKHQLSTPVIVIRDSNADIQQALDNGVSDVISPEDDSRLIFASFRELGNLQCRRELETLSEKLKESEERSEQLMAQSQDAIAYVADGMIINTNELFSSRFGYKNPGDIDCVPIIDLIADAEHEKFKGLLKAQTSSTEGSTDLEFTGVNESGDEFSAAMQLSNAIFDSEACIQITVRDEISNSSSGSNGVADYDEATGLYSHFYFLRQLDSQLKQAIAGSSTSNLLFISIDRFYTLRNQHGITAAENILIDIAKFIQQQAKDATCISHYCDDAFTLLLPEIDSKKALTIATTLCQSIADHIIDANGQSIQCSASIGIVPLNPQCPEDPRMLIEDAFCAAETVREDAENNIVDHAAAIFVPQVIKKSLGDAQSDDDLDSFLEEALEDGRFGLMFNPIVSLKGTSGDHYEVETVMNTDDGEIKSADEFLGTLNFNTANTRLDRWIILEATKQLATQQDSGNDVRLIINLTPNALQDESLLPWLSVVIKAGNLPADSLIFQFRSEDIKTLLKPAISFTAELKKIGVNLSISNFGNSDQPFDILKKLDVSFAKISPRFTQQLQETGDMTALKNLVQNISEKSINAIISNVENASSMAVIWQIGVDYIQGGYLAPPSNEMNYEFTDIA